MKITMYELLGLIKDGKEPKQIVFDGDIYTFNEEKENYYMDENICINWNYVVMCDLSNRIEIIEEYKKIKKLIKTSKINAIIDEEPKWSEQYELEDVGNKINEIIDILNEGDK